jgi:hypothetical protein
MTSKARSKSTNKKPGATAADRRVLAQAAREDAEGKGPAAPLQTPAQIIREARDRARQAACYEGGTPESVENLEAAERDGDVLVPVTIRDVCRMVGVDCEPENFAPTALMELSKQLDSLSDLANENSNGGYENWKLVQNLAARAALAGRVAAWLDEPGPATELPEVTP